MKKFSNMILASDFDGTLKNDSGTVDKCVLDAIAYFEDNGGYFTLSTGRTLQGLCLYDFPYINAPALLANGALAYDLGKDEVLFLDGIGSEGRDFVRDIAARFDGVSIEMYPLGCTCAINLTDDTHRHFSCQGIQYNEITDPDEAPVPWQKIMVSGPKKMLLDLQSYMSQNYEHPSYLPTEGTIVEILAKSVDKGTGLLKLADCLGVGHDRVFSIGDGYNDREMLTAAHACFVPENGDEEMKAIATYRVRSNNDGAVAHAIEILDEIYG